MTEKFIITDGMVVGVKSEIEEDWRRIFDLAEIHIPNIKTKYSYMITHYPSPYYAVHSFKHHDDGTLTPGPDGKVKRYLVFTEFYGRDY